MRIWEVQFWKGAPLEFRRSLFIDERTAYNFAEVAKSAGFDTQKQELEVWTPSTLVGNQYYQEFKGDSKVTNAV